MAFDLKSLISGKKEIAKDGEIKSMPKKQPETIDFSALWDDPQESTIMPLILGGISAVSSAILLIMKIMGH